MYACKYICAKLRTCMRISTDATAAFPPPSSPRPRSPPSPRMACKIFSIPKANTSHHPGMEVCQGNPSRQQRLSFHILPTCYLLLLYAAAISISLPPPPPPNSIPLTPIV